jgi:hypothetical protein
MKIQKIAALKGRSVRTITRKIQTFNEANGTSHPSGTKAEITDKDLLKFLEIPTNLRSEFSSHFYKPLSQDPELGEVIVRPKDMRKVEPEGWPISLSDDNNLPDNQVDENKIDDQAARDDVFKKFKDQSNEQLEETRKRLKEATKATEAIKLELEQFKKAAQARPGSEENVKVKRKTGDKISDFLILITLPMLGLPASYGVYLFASQFAPEAIAIIEAASFELTYISLSASKKLYKLQRKKAKVVALAAVFVSVVYNIIAGKIHVLNESQVFTDTLGPVWFWILAIVHGAPLALLAYFVADLRFHTKEK